MNELNERDPGGSPPRTPFRRRSRGPAIPAPLRRARPWRAYHGPFDYPPTLRAITVSYILTYSRAERSQEWSCIMPAV